jgi:hypothetical protein
MNTALTDDQLMTLRVARGDHVPDSDFTTSQTRHHDQNLLVAMLLIERRRGSFEITSRGADYLDRFDADALSGNSDHQTAGRIR